jgi:hypothetical protein
MHRHAIILVVLFQVSLVCAASPQTTEIPKSAHRTSHPRSSGSGSKGNGAFALNCKLPFDGIATKPDPFAPCGNCGVVSSSPPATPAENQAKAAQSQAKNNFCANASSPAAFTFADLRNMQAESKKNNWVVKDLPDRKVLHGFYKSGGRPVGEGDVIRLVAWVLDAHVSDCPSGESVNCEIPGFASNDLHIPLTDPSSGPRTQDECSSVTAEMSPHFRPTDWSNLDMKTPVTNVVRVTGPLFFDNAHEPCRGLTKAQGDAAPFRSSLWEIHPVYGFEVCSNADPKKCDINSSDTKVWIPYDHWVKTAPPSAVQPTGKSQRSATACANPTAAKSGSVPAQCPGPL